MDNLFVATWWLDLGDQYGNYIQGNLWFEAISGVYR
jgi:hypothetical protein